MSEFADAAAVLERGLAARAYSAVTAEVGRTTGVLWTYSGGTLEFSSATRVDPGTVFDLASLTKALATTAIALDLAARAAFDLDAPVASVLSSWRRADRAGVTFRDLLEHASGLPAHREYFREHRGRDAYDAAIAAEPLEYARRARSIYSDLGFIALGFALEDLGAGSLAQQFDRWKAAAPIDAPLMYRPPPGWRAHTAVTEVDAWRGRLLQGEVHDGNADALGGVAAHAGLFGTAAAVGACARWWLHALGTGPGARHDALAQRFVRRSSVPGSSRALGWDTMLPTSSCGSRMSPRAVGHTGFTGTSLWIDPEQDVYFVLLTNRVHASHANDAIQAIRRGFHDAAATAVSGAPRP